jgi:hypothetical protein
MPSHSNARQTQQADFCGRCRRWRRQWRALARQRQDHRCTQPGHPRWSRVCGGENSWHWLRDTQLREEAHRYCEEEKELLRLACGESLPQRRRLDDS